MNFHVFKQAQVLNILLASFWVSAVFTNRCAINLLFPLLGLATKGLADRSVLSDAVRIA